MHQYCILPNPVFPTVRHSYSCSPRHTHSWDARCTARGGGLLAGLAITHVGGAGSVRGQGARHPPTKPPTSRDRAQGVYAAGLSTSISQTQGSQAGISCGAACGCMMVKMMVWRRRVVISPGEDLVHCGLGRASIRVPSLGTSLPSSDASPPLPCPRRLPGPRGFEAITR